MFENKFVNLLLKLFPRSKWNLLSNLLARASIPNIGSPISFRRNGFSLKEINLLEISELERNKFLDFCYPIDMPNREKEITLDCQYWRYASIFLVLNRAHEIVGHVQYIPKKENNKIPVEFGIITDSENIFRPDLNEIPNGKFAEIYRCRRSNNLQGMDSVVVISMLFKALWAKIIQTNTAYSYITFDSMINELRNLYVRKLSFSDPNISLHFGENKKKWKLLFKDWTAHENFFASIGKPHFYLQTWVRKNLKQKNLRIPQFKPVAADLISEEETLLFANVYGTNQNQTAMRRRVLEQADEKTPAHEGLSR